MVSSDGQLLSRFIASRDEQAFEELVSRHGQMVMGLASRMTSGNDDAEDVFQATSMVLASKASSLRKQESVASWLHGVAVRTAGKARTGAALRARHERRVAELSAKRVDSERQVAWRRAGPVLDEELRKLPEKYRAPLVLCYLEGLTNAEAARSLGWTKGTVSGRLARARALLKDRLARRDAVLSASLLASLLQENGRVAASAALTAQTGKAAVALISGASGAGLLSAGATALMEGVLRMLFLTKLKVIAGVMAGVVAVGAGTGLVIHEVAAGEAAAKDKTAGAPKPLVVKGMEVTIAHKAVFYANDGLSVKLKLRNVSKKNLTVVFTRGGGIGGTRIGRMTWEVKDAGTGKVWKTGRDPRPGERPGAPVMMGRRTLKPGEAFELTSSVLGWDRRFWQGKEESKPARTAKRLPAGKYVISLTVNIAGKGVDEWRADFTVKTGQFEVSAENRPEPKPGRKNRKELVALARQKMISNWKNLRERGNANCKALARSHLQAAEVTVKEHDRPDRKTWEITFLAPCKKLGGKIRFSWTLDEFGREHSSSGVSLVRDKPAK